MNLSMFPTKFNSESHANEQRDLDNASNEKRKQIDNINNRRIGSSDFEGLFSGGVSLGFFLGLIACFTNCDSLSDSFGLFLGSIVLGCIGGVGLCILMAIYSLVSNSNADKNIRKVEDSHVIQENNIIERAEKERQEYLMAFETEAQTRSVKFANSELAQEVITWMSEGFFRNIDAADRRSHIEQISVPFLFSIYAHKITCNLGTYDFELKRCENLKSAIDQTALARAIASTIQLNVMMKYPNDMSGTAISIMIEYTYNDNCVNALITYVAPNGNYKPVKGW